MEEANNCLLCGRPLGRKPRSAPHKKFCSESHRKEFHRKEQAEALKIVRAQRGEVEDTAPVVTAEEVDL